MLRNKENKSNITPYVPANKSMSEFTWTSVWIGIILSIVFASANAYLGLRIGMTVSASIPASVISMGIIRGILKRNSILENNIVQTISSAGQSLASGVIFTIPALYIWANEMGIEPPTMKKITIISVVGGILGVLLMVPLRRFLMIEEHEHLPYPEGTACAEVLVAGEVGGTNAKTVLKGVGIGAIYKFIVDGIKLFPGAIEWKISGIKNAVIGMDVYPALLGVGFIIGPKISSYMMAGAILGWLGIIPLISYLGDFMNVPIYPAIKPIQDLGAYGIWDYYIRYVGTGAVAFGGFMSLIKALPLTIDAFKDVLGGFTPSLKQVIQRTDEDLSMYFVLMSMGILVLLIIFTPIIPVGAVGGTLIVIFSFLFATVSARLVGLIGTSSNPISGMTIASLLITTFIFKKLGITGQEGMTEALIIGSIICIVVAIAGDISQDLKTGVLVGATPKKQQIGELIGVIAAGLVMGMILTLLNYAFGFGSKEIPAPQATLMRLVVEGIMNGNLPWPLFFTGVAAGMVVEILGISVLPFAVGLYLPIHLSTPIMVGGLIRGMLNKREKIKMVLKEKTEGGTLYASGLIAGEGLTGIFLAILASIQVGDVTLANKLSIGHKVLGKYGSILMFGVLVFFLVKNSFGKKVEY
ncbi:OPT family oligopeptide transporter [Inediibacterium massiliense]|uniref:OPT family oligopeptide transporter n=1 Tax=Inediibacterium massiliense TaxID=1658111 RepID=UPI000AE1C935|nr:oligopeptide transporter, OPT family [Inediibacterium massiliense]